MELRDRTVVVTGASMGIGEQLAVECARRGAKVLVVARSADRLADLAAQIDGVALTVDLTDPDQVDTFVSRCLDALGNIDVLVNNAGLTNFAKSLRVELRHTDIGITVVAPGPTATAIWERIEDTPTHYPDPALKRVWRTRPVASGKRP